MPQHIWLTHLGGCNDFCPKHNLLINALIPSAFDEETSLEESNENSEEDSSNEAPASPELYDLEDNQQPSGESGTLVRSYAPSRLHIYDDNPYGGWGPPSNWPMTLLSEIEPNPEPWPYPPC